MAACTLQLNLSLPSGKKGRGSDGPGGRRDNLRRRPRGLLGRLGGLLNPLSWLGGKANSLDTGADTRRVLHAAAALVLLRSRAATPLCRPLTLAAGKKALVSSNRDALLMTAPFLLWTAVIVVLYATSYVQLRQVRARRACGAPHAGGPTHDDATRGRCVC